MGSHDDQPDVSLFRRFENGRSGVRFDDPDRMPNAL